MQIGAHLKRKEKPPCEFTNKQGWLSSKLTLNVIVILLERKRKEVEKGKSKKRSADS